jgi:hypothetical protein
MNQSVDIDGLAATLQREYESADSYSERLAKLSGFAFHYYEAQPFGNEIEGRSQIVLPDVQEATDYMQQSVLRTFVSGDRTVEFEAADEADAQAAEDASAGINYLFMRQQDGFRILHDGLYDGLLRKIGVFETCVETVEKVSRQRVRTNEEQLALLMDSEGWDIEDISDNGDGMVTAKLRKEATEKRFVEYAIPPGEFKFSPNSSHEDDADYLCRASLRTRSDLVGMGFDSDQVYALPAHTGMDEWRSESLELDQYGQMQTEPALEQVMLCKEYARIDLDGDGIAERVRVFRVGNEILKDAESGEPDIETVEDQPFAVFCPFPRPHRMVGYSLADKVMHIQYQRSFVARQLFDGLALSNMPRQIVDSSMADEDTYEDILSPVPGSPIRVRGGASSVQAMQTSFDPAKSLAVMEWITGERESLTGITRLNQGLDADTLNKTATGTAMMQAQGQQIEESIARQFAETISRLFAKKYRLMRAEADPFKVKVDGQYRMVDPSTWPEDINIVVKVGLGTNSKDRRIQHRMAMMQALTASVQNGNSGAEHVFKWFDGMARDTGLGQGDDFAFDPKTMPPQGQQGPDPEMAKVQLEAEKAKAHLDLQRENNAANIGAMREKHSLEMQQRREEAALENQLARDRADAEYQLAIYKIDRGAEVSRYQSDMTTSRAGGRLDA